MERKSCLGCGELSLETESLCWACGSRDFSLAGAPGEATIQWDLVQEPTLAWAAPAARFSLPNFVRRPMFVGGVGSFALVLAFSVGCAVGRQGPEAPLPTTSAGFSPAASSNGFAPAPPSNGFSPAPAVTAAPLTLPEPPASPAVQAPPPAWPTLPTPPAFNAPTPPAPSPQLRARRAEMELPPSVLLYGVRRGNGRIVRAYRTGDPGGFWSGAPGQMP